MKTTTSATKTWKGLEITENSCVWVRLHGNKWAVAGVVELTDTYFCLEGCVGAFYFDGTQEIYSYEIGNVYKVLSTWPLKNNSPLANYEKL